MLQDFQAVFALDELPSVQDSQGAFRATVCAVSRTYPIRTTPSLPNPNLPTLAFLFICAFYLINIDTTTRLTYDMSSNRANPPSVPPSSPFPHSTRAPVSL